MKRIFVSTLMALVASASLFATKPQGKLVFESTSHHLGTFPKSQVRTCVFVACNKGNAPVVIEYVMPACNCTNVKFSRQPILPGKKAYLTLYYNGAAYDKGQFRKSVDVHSTGSNSVVRLFVSGTTK